VQHPVLMTECLLNPLYARQKMAELLFEVYGVPSVAFGTDAMFSHLYNRTAGRCGQDGEGRLYFLEEQPSRGSRQLSLRKLPLVEDIPWALLLGQ
jgi:actin-related protein